MTGAYCLLADPSVAENFQVDVVFQNLNKRTNLGSSPAQVSKVDCAKGFCGDSMPDGIFTKKTEFYVGEFSELFDLTAYPFDQQRFDFNFSMITTFGEVAMYSPPQTITAHEVSGAYEMNDITCESVTTSSGTSGYCYIIAVRVWKPELVNTIIPSILFVLIAIFSLQMSIKLAMPRVGSTLFALLILTTYRNEIGRAHV